MPSTRLRLAPDVVGQLTDGLDRLRAELGLTPDFGPAAQAEAEAAAARGPADVPGRDVPRRDATDIPFLTKWGTPLLLGPGSIHVAHTDREHVRIAELDEAVGLYEQVARTLLSE